MHFQQIFSFVSQVRYLFYHTRKRLSRLFSNFFQKVFWAFCEFAIQKSICASLTFTLFLIEKPLSFSPLSCDSSNILSYLQAVVKTFFKLFSKVFWVFFEFRFRNSILRTFIFDPCLSRKSPFYRVFSPLSRDSLFIISQPLLNVNTFFRIF